MKKKRTKVAAMILVLLLLWGVLFFADPRARVRTFVALHGESLETAIQTSQGIPANLGIKSFNTWEEEHPMTEFILSTSGNGYYGCYYSPDDVPLPFQNADVELTQDGHEYWTWEESGDNHGITEKIEDHWYYFEAFL